MKSLSFVLLLTLLVTSSASQLPLDTRVYRYDRFGIEFAYPAAFKMSDLSCGMAQIYAQRGYQGLAVLHSDTNDVTVFAFLDRRPFSLDTLREMDSRGGDRPIRANFGLNTFYHYDKNGGAAGDYYGDDYFYDLDGRILGINFSYPRTLAMGGSAPPFIKNLEAQVLSSFKRIERIE